LFSITELKLISNSDSIDEQKMYLLDKHPYNTIM
jgi:hypothetical protein